MPQLPLVGHHDGPLRDAICWRWRKLRDLTGEFDKPEDSERSRRLTWCWDRTGQVSSRWATG
jgi:hypothetical protein